MEGIQCETLWPASPDDFCTKGGGNKEPPAFPGVSPVTWRTSAGPHCLSNTRVRTHVASAASLGPDGLMHCPGCSEVSGHESLEGMCGGQSPDCGV